MYAGIGFTGSRDGMSAIQKKMVFELLLRMNKGCWTYGQYPPTKHNPERDPRAIRFHHGCCDGSDSQASYLAAVVGFWVEGHPPDNPGKFGGKHYADFMHQPLPYLERNRVIVNMSNTAVIATPSTTEEEGRRSGTWYTIRYAKVKRKKIYIILPWGETLLHKPLSE